MGTKLKGNPVSLIGKFLSVGVKAPDFSLLKSDLTEVSLDHFQGKIKVISIFPSVDTAVCALALKTFNQKASQYPKAVILNVSKDLPFALKRFCAAEGISAVETLSAFRSSFGKDYGIELADSGLKGLLARAVLVLDQHNQVVYSELVDDITSEPQYEAALTAIQKIGY